MVTVVVAVAAASSEGVDGRAGGGAAALRGYLGQLAAVTLPAIAIAAAAAGAATGGHGRELTAVGRGAVSRSPGTVASVPPAGPIIRAIDAA